MMGLFDKVVKSVVGGKVEDLIEQATGRRGDYPAQQTSQSTSASDRHRFVNVPVPAGNRPDHAYFAQLLQEKFAQYQIKEYVPVAELGGSGKDYDFGLYEGGSLRGVIMLTEHNRDNNQAYKGAKAACQAAGLPFINFYLHMPNERGYIINRIKTLLGLM
jgi:hypothetical protein